MRKLANITCILLNMISLIHPHTCGFAKAATWEFTRAVVTKITRDENAMPRNPKLKKRKKEGTVIERLSKQRKLNGKRQRWSGKYHIH